MSESLKISKTVTEPAISVQHLIKRYGDFVAVNDVSFEIKWGETYGRLVDWIMEYVGKLKFPRLKGD